MQLPDINKVESKNYFETIVDLLKDIATARAWMDEFKNRFGRELKTNDAPEYLVSTKDGKFGVTRRVGEIVEEISAWDAVDNNWSWNVYYSIWSDGSIRVGKLKNRIVENVPWRETGDPAPKPVVDLGKIDKQIDENEAALSTKDNGLFERAKLLKKRGALAGNRKAIVKKWTREQNLVNKIDEKYPVGPGDGLKIAKYIDDDAYRSMKEYLKRLVERIAEAAGSGDSLRSMLDEIETQYSAWAVEKQKI